MPLRRVAADRVMPAIRWLPSRLRRMQPTLEPPSRAVSIARHPGADVLGAITKLYALRFACSQEAHGLTIDEHKVSKLQGDRARGRFASEQGGQLAQAVGLQPTAECEDDVAIRCALDLQHKFPSSLGNANPDPEASYLL